MNKASIFYLLIFFVVASCDNSSNVAPASENYFLKFYGQTGYQEGVDVRQTSDGGYIIAGNSIQIFEGQSDYLLIKVDAQGNQEWQQTYDFGGEDRMTEVVIADNEYVFAGTSNVNGKDKIVLLRVNMDGTELGSYEVQQIDTVYNYKCTGLTYSESGNFLVVGTTDLPINFQNVENSIFTFLNNDWSVEKVKYSGDENQPLTFTKAYEVEDSQTQLPNYLVFGYRLVSGEIRMGLFQYNNLFESSNSSSFTSNSNTKTVDVIPIEDGKFMMLGSADNLSTLLEIRKLSDQSGDRYLVGLGYAIRLNSIVANGISRIDQNEYIISGDIQIENSDITKASFFNSNSNGGVDWIKQFGTTSSYNAGKLRVLTDGSIVFTGTAVLGSQTKVFLVKSKSNGEMK